VLYYVARNRTIGYDQWIVGPDSVGEFQKNADAYFAGAALAYAYGAPHGYEAESARFVWGGGNLGSACGQALHDPKFLLQAAAAHPAVGGATTQVLASSVKAAVVTAAPTLAPKVDPDIDKAVERSFVEQAPTSQPAAKPPLRRVEKSTDAAQAREDFNKVRD